MEDRQVSLGEPSVSADYTESRTIWSIIKEHRVDRKAVTSVFVASSVVDRLTTTTHTHTQEGLYIYSLAIKKRMMRNPPQICNLLFLIICYCNVNEDNAFEQHRPSIRHGHSISIRDKSIRNKKPLLSLHPHFQKQNEREHVDALNMMPLIPRGGATAAAAASSITSSLTNVLQSPSSLFHSALISILSVTALMKVPNMIKSMKESSSTKALNSPPKAIKNLQMRFLVVFWLLRCADWLQGPYFYEVYASKMFFGAPATSTMISRLFLTGFASTAVFGPLVGQFADANGRKLGTILFTLCYAIGALSTKSALIWMLILGRIWNGIGTGLLFSAPEAWVVGEMAGKENKYGKGGGRFLGETFGLAYAGDSIVAILAGQLASIAASVRGPSGPFELSVVFLALGAILAGFLWEENVADKSSSSDGKKPNIKDALKLIRADPKIMLVGGTQSLFEAAMYIFVLQWPPAIASAVAKKFGSDAITPYGTVFSCFMGCCLIGSTLFNRFTKIPKEFVMSIMLLVATISMTLSRISLLPGVALGGWASLITLVLGFFTFEACVGMYFPGIGTLRSKYVPDSHRSVIMNLFGIPLNALVVTVYLFIQKLGVGGALGISSGALGLATACMWKLWRIVEKEEKVAADAVPATA